MPFQIVNSDITEMKTDAIVNAANTHLLQGGGVCGAIFEKAGADLLQEECQRIGTCPTGQSVITKGYKLPARYIIHAVGPIWEDGMHGEEKLLRLAYRSSLQLAREYQLSSVAFPLISSGIYGYPKEEAVKAAVAEIKEFLMNNDIDVYLVIYESTSALQTKKNWQTNTLIMNRSLYSEICRYVEIKSDRRDLPENYFGFKEKSCDYHTPDQEDNSSCSHCLIEDLSEKSYYQLQRPASINLSDARKLEDVLCHMEETFSEMLLRLIKEKGKTEVEVYKKANMDRKLFSKLRGSQNYQPKKSTALALAISLNLSLEETKDLLLKAGYSLSLSQKSDVIIQYFIEKGNYDIFEINEALFCFEQPLLGI